MGRVENKYDSLKNAVKRLNEANTAFRSDSGNSMYRDSLIKRFEFTFELGWKTLREFIAEQGFSLAVASPKNVIAVAYQEGFIDGEELWLDMLEARNATAHDYDDEVSGEIAIKISNRYCKELQKLCKFIGENLSN